MHPLLIVSLAAWLGLASLSALAADHCEHRGDLDLPYCDNNRDLVADPPTDPKRWRSPNTIVFSYTPIEEPAVYERLFRPFASYLSQCAGRRAVFFPVQSNAAEIEAMRSGRVHIAWFSTGPTAFAVNIAGAVPFAMRGNEQGPHGYHLLLIVRSDSPFRKPADLQGKRVAHTSPSSNSGHLAPLALLPKEGLRPEKDYPVVFSGKHDRSILGVMQGEYDAATVASDVFRRMVQRGQIREADFRIVYQSPVFPTESVTYSHDLEPALRERLLKCIYDYRFSEEMRAAFDGADRLVPVDYQKGWAIVRQVAESAGEKFNRRAYEREAKGGK